MIKSITVINHLNESILLELGSPEKSGLLVQNVEGLGPGKATINKTEISTKDGAIFNSSRVESRNIVFSLAFLESPSIESARQKTYKYFPIKKRVDLVIETDNRVCQTYGYVESNEPDIFNKAENTTISIVCPDPYFYSNEAFRTIFATIEPIFEFPFSNESLTENLIEFGNIINENIKTIFYSGDINIGVLINLHFVGSATNISIFNTRTRETMTIDTELFELLVGSPITFGDDIIISTFKGEKFIYLFRNGEYINILNCLGRNIDWFELEKGDNVFTYTADFGLQNIQFAVTNKVAYEGV